MSVMGYLTAGSGELRMGRGPSRIHGLEFTGPVLNGLRSVEEQRAESAVAMGVAEDREVYRNVRYYDPVLRAHCRL